MKKFAILLIIVFVLIFVSGCSQNLYVQSRQNLAEIDYACFSYTNEKCKITFISGKREKNYKVDGKTSDLINFGILQFDLFETVNVSKITAKLFVNNKLYSKDLIFNPLDYSFVEDFKINVNFNDNLFVKLILQTSKGEQIIENKLSLVNINWKLNNFGALKFATEILEDRLKDSFCENGQLKAEVFVQIITEKRINKFFYLICFVNEKLEKLQIIIDPTNENYLIDNS